ncbi:MAG: YqgE/AlgH family protein [Cyclobacteriaceae bacterium]|nr:YqgE/AlgH family protein [Cyclobacteriaceae bacterium]MCK5278187.1 YqgE/AlgH family protein [Cyclobacteriaceae bacterium]MCK5705449.1 YqgE/AlgH family protein [Cyclobacteriaceae bacterium]
MELFNYSDDKVEPQKGDILISEPFLADPNFVRTVILLCEHNDDGSFGFVLNKPAQIKINELIEGVENREDDIYIGGPVQQNTLQFIHRNDGLIEGGAEIKEGIFWGGSFEQMLTMMDSNLIKASDIKFFIGYSGWASGQLKSELEVNSWIISRNVNIEQIFDTDDKSLWKEVLNTMGGKYKIVANFPVDPRLN